MSAYICRTCGVTERTTPPREHQKYCSRHCQATALMEAARARFPVRFWASVRKDTGDGCWPWAGKRNAKGYGVVSVGSLRDDTRGHKLAHRVAWELTNGDIPDGLCACHRCDMPSCCRPDHLFLGTTADNNADCVAKGRQVRGEAHGQAKLNRDQVIDIRRLHARGDRSCASIVREFGVSQATVWLIVRERIWKTPQLVGGGAA